jgi:pyrimidine-nucleoside phosphorylase
VELAARMLMLGQVASDRADAERRVRDALASGSGLERLERIIEHQGGDPRVVTDYSRLPSAPERHLVRAPRSGYLTALDAESIGKASVALGAGRDRVEDAVDHSVGIMVLAKPGDRVSAGEPVLELRYRDVGKRDHALALAERAVVVGESRPAPRPVIVGEV